MPKANLLIINYCILAMKADNEPAISLPVYFKSVKKWKYVLRKKQKNKRTKKKGRESDVDVQRVICCTTTSNSEGARYINP